MQQHVILKQTVTVEDTNCVLVFDKRFHLLEVKVNGTYAGKVMFGDKIDVSFLLGVNISSFSAT